MSNGTELQNICFDLELNKKLSASDLGFLRDLIPILDQYEELEEQNITTEQINEAMNKAEKYDELKEIVDNFISKLSDFDPKFLEGLDK